MASSNKDHAFTTSTLYIIVIFLYLMSCCHSCDSGTCIGHGEACDAIEFCLGDFICTDYTMEHQTRCLCNQSNYYVMNVGCVSVNTLRVSAVNVAVTGTDFISLSWTANNLYNKNVSYYMNTSDQSVPANPTGGTIRNLKSGQHYSIKTISSLSEMFYPTMTTFYQFDYAMTMAQYNESCNSITICETGTQCLTGFCLCKDTEYRLNNSCHPKKSNGAGCIGNAECSTPFECRNDKNNIKRCLCAAYNYFTSSNNSCTSVTQLQVKNPSVQSRTTSSMYITWSVNTGIPANVNYKIQAGSSSPVTASSTGGNATGLSPGQQYNLWIISTFPADNYYPNLNTSVSVTYWTSNTYAGICSDSSPGCDASTTCIKPFTSSNTLCLCDSNHNYATDNFRCLSLSNLLVQDIQWTTGTHNINFNWSTTHVLRANATYAIIDATNSNTLLNTSSGASGANLTNLVPGTKYSLKIRSELPSDNYYNSLSFTGDVLDIVTYPGKPGKVYNVKQLPNTTTNGPYEYMIYFGASEGNVANYTFVIKNDTSVVDTLINSTPFVVSNNLTTARIYSYEVTAKNLRMNMSEITTGTFPTSARPSDEQPSNLQIPADNITAYTAIVTWKMPNNPNGKITGYVLYVTYSNQSCLQVYYVGCMDCSLQNLATPDKCQRFEITRKNYTQNYLNSHSSNIAMEISRLDLYTNYTVVVLPYNDAGQGKQASQSFTTKTAPASNLISVSLNATRDANKVGLNVTWIPGRFTGPTNYTVKLEEKISLSSDSYTTKDTKEVVGYDKNFIYFPELLGYWDYKVTVTANTNEGQSSPKVESTKTFMKPPGLAAFNITVDPIVATKVTISINCPDEKERNGIIVKYTVKKILLKSDGNDPDMILFQSIDRTQESENPCEVTKQLVTDVRVERNYSVEVATINKEFSGVFSGGNNFYVPAKFPFPLATDTVKMLSTSETKLEVTICRDCVASETQGRIRDLWLAVCSVYSYCFHSVKRKRSADAAIVNITWSEAKKSGFTIGYRTTPLDWLNQLRVSQDRFVNYIIGRDTTCEIGDTGYCNGPLPSNTKFKILVLECNNAGCVSLSSETVATKDEEANYTALAVGLSLGLLCIIIISIVAVVCIKRHHRNKKSEAMRRQAPLYNTLNRTFQDDHLYGIANDKMTPVIREPEHVNQPASNEDVYQEITDSKNYQVTSVDDYQNSISAVKSK